TLYDLDRQRHEPVALVERQGRRLRRRAVHEDPVRAFRKLHLDQPGIGVVVDLAVAERGDQGRDRAAESFEHGPERPKVRYRAERTTRAPARQMHGPRLTAVAAAN